ncbi:MAG: GTP 3',8-cyclase MoaA [Verrucomicrobiota bacterium]|nr:GTP 3',8-cyclase MoaA [Verrucomicrobiota bacterium]
MTQRGVLRDTYNRTIRDLRISITDRCNFRCTYCLPDTEEAANFYQSSKSPALKASAKKKIIHNWKPKSEILSFEEITRIVKVSSSLGVNKIRITGGEPLLRRGTESLISSISNLGVIEDLSLTSNGSKFPSLAKKLKEAGLTRITLSLDSLNHKNFRRITGFDGLDDIIESIQLAKALDLTPIKVNAVIIRGINDHEIESLADLAIRKKNIMRMIEFMPLDSGRTWQRSHVVPGQEILNRIKSKFSLSPLPAQSISETASRWAIGNSEAEIGIIAPVTNPFCGNCNRIRLTSDGKIRTCLFSLNEHDLKSTIRNGASDYQLASKIKEIVFKKEAGHQIGKTEFIQPKRSMSSIGG